MRRYRQRLYARMIEGAELEELMEICQVVGLPLSAPSTLALWSNPWVRISVAPVNRGRAIDYTPGGKKKV